MTRLVLAKHALPDLDQKVPPADWHLGESGRSGATRLGEALRSLEFPIAEVVCSTEPKALETATIACRALGIDPPHPCDGLREHHRATAGFPSTERFEELAKALFTQPDELVWGEETANQARERFSKAIEEVATDALLVVAHGTVISLYVEGLCEIDGYELWQDLGLPSYVVVDTAKRRILRTVMSI